MKTKLFTLLLAIMATNSLWAKFQYGNLYYEKISSNTAEVVGYLGEPTSVTIPSVVQYNGAQYTVTSIGNSAFDECSSLTSVTIPNSVTSFGIYAFGHCISLTSVTIPNSVTKIGDYAFGGCKSLTSITIPNSVTSIGIYAFGHCFSLTSITIPNSVTKIGDDAFIGCKSLTSITIPNSVTKIGDYAFSGCKSITSITIPNSVTKIGNYAFQNCSSLTSIVVENGNVNYDSREGCNAIIETATNTLIQGCATTIIPNNVTSIEDYAFCGSSLTSVTIPNSVTSIGMYAFYGCSSLTTVTIPNSVTKIGNCAFYNCSFLISATIGNSVTSIGKYVFGNCSLNKVVCEAVLVPSTESNAFENVVTSSAILYVPDEAVDIYKYMDPWDKFGTILPISQLPTDVENVQTIGGMDPPKKKLIRDGQVVILHNDKSYNIMGQEIK